MLKLNEQIYDAIRRHGEETYPDECCGVLLGRAVAPNGSADEIQGA
jgi:proteasome lid subunit RPN8/RPN11